MYHVDNFNLTKTKSFITLVTKPDYEVTKSQL